MSNILSTAAAYKVLKGDKPRSEGSAPRTFTESVFSKPLTWAVIIGAAGYVIYRSLKKSPEKKTDEALKKDIEAAAKAKQVLSYPLSNYQGYADKIQQSFTANANPFDRVIEEYIYDVMKAMKNDLDVFQLIKAFGQRPEPTPLIRFAKDNVGLADWLTIGLDADELQTVNKILSNKGIKYQF